MFYCVRIYAISPSDCLLQTKIFFCSKRFCVRCEGCNVRVSIVERFHSEHLNKDHMQIVGWRRVGYCRWELSISKRERIFFRSIFLTFFTIVKGRKRILENTCYTSLSSIAYPQRRAVSPAKTRPGRETVAARALVLAKET